MRETIVEQPDITSQLRTQAAKQRCHIFSSSNYVNSEKLQKLLAAHSCIGEQGYHSQKVPQKCDKSQQKGKKMPNKCQDIPVKCQKTQEQYSHPKEQYSHPAEKCPQTWRKCDTTQGFISDLPQTEALDLRKSPKCDTKGSSFVKTVASCDTDNCAISTDCLIGKRSSHEKCELQSSSCPRDRNSSSNTSNISLGKRQQESNSDKCNTYHQQDQEGPTAKKPKTSENQNGQGPHETKQNGDKNGQKYSFKVEIKNPFVLTKLFQNMEKFVVNIFLPFKKTCRLDGLKA